MREKSYLEVKAFTSGEFSYAAIDRAILSYAVFDFALSAAERETLEPSVAQTEPASAGHSMSHASAPQTASKDTGYDAWQTL
jgi:hypothetical protein